VGYLNVTTRDLLDHLYSQYARISTSDLQDNDRKFKEPYDANLPLETLFHRIEHAIDYAAAASTPYSAEQVVATAYQLLFATGLFQEDCKTWKRQAATYKTWAHFKRDFALAHREFRENKTTVAGHAYHATTETANHQDIGDALSHLATATAHDRVTVATLAQTNATLTAEIAVLTSKLVTALAEITRLTTSSRQTQPSSAAPAVSTCHYCWTCGYRCTHYSSQCPNPKPGHQKGAKAADTMGGSVLNKP
jgi:hypothetical protein